MRIKYNFIFLPLLIIAAAAVYFMILQDKEDKSASRIADRALLDIGEVNVIEIEREESLIRIERVNPGGDGPGSASDWKITSPYAAGCNPETLAAVIDSITESEVERDIPDITPGQQAEYGLDNPEINVRVISSGVIVMNLKIGMENASGTSRYASFADDPANCFLIPKYFFGGFEYTADEIRDIRALPFTEEEIESIQISSAVADIRIERYDENWMVTEPRLFSASPARLDIFFHNVLELYAVEFLPGDAPDPELLENSASVTFGMRNGAPLELNLHGEDYSRGIFATSTYQPTPFIVEAYIYDRIALDPNVFFQILLIDIPTSQIKRVLVRQPSAENLEIERTGPDITEWRVLRPSGRTVADQRDFETFINMLLMLTPDKNIDPPQNPGDYGFDPVYFMKLEIYPEDSGALKESVIYVGNLDANGDYYATQDKVTYFTIERNLMDGFIQILDKLRSPSL